MRFATILAIFIGCMTLAGCASYRFGSTALFPTEIQTVHVPIVRNQTFRHDLGVRLTEALVIEIERRTPYRVVSNPNADSILRCSVVNERKSVLTETQNDDPRALDATITVAANWTSRDGRPLMQNSLSMGETDQITFSHASQFVPEAGQSIDTATQDAIERLARRIVAQMEVRW